MDKVEGLISDEPPPEKEKLEHQTEPTAEISEERGGGGGGGQTWLCPLREKELLHQERTAEPLSHEAGYLSLLKILEAGGSGGGFLDGQMKERRRSELPGGQT